MKFVGKSIIGKKKAKEGFKYPIVRFPLEFREIIGRKAKIYEIDRGKFLIDVELDNQLDNSFEFVKVDKNLLEKAKEFGINVNSLIEGKLRRLISQKIRVRPPGFEPGQRAREARVLPLDYDRSINC